MNPPEAKSKPRIFTGIKKVGSWMGVQTVAETSATPKVASETPLPGAPAPMRVETPQVDFNAVKPQVPPAVESAFKNDPAGSLDPTVPAPTPIESGPTNPEPAATIVPVEPPPAAEAPSPPTIPTPDTETPVMTPTMPSAEVVAPPAVPVMEPLQFPQPSSEPMSIPQPEEVAASQKKDGIATLLYKSDPGKYLETGADGKPHLNKSRLLTDSRELKNDPVKMIELFPELKSELDEAGVDITSSITFSNT